MNLGLAGKTALVTGGSAGLGLGAARALAEEGADLAICARNEERLGAAVEELSRIASGKVIGLRADVAVLDEPARVVRDAERALGGISILIANAGGPPAGSILDLTEEQWQTGYQRTLMSAVRLTRAVIPGMVARGWGRILYITSTTVKQPIDGLLLSNVFRPGIAGLAKTIASELAPHGITVNSVCPGPYETDRITELLAIRAKKAGITLEEERGRYLAGVPAGRFGLPIELGRTIAFLASEQSAFVTGCAWSVDGGSTRGIHG